MTSRSLRELPLREVLVALAFVVTAVATAPVHAQANPLDDLPAVRNKVLLHEGRHALTPMFTFTANDPYVSNLMLGVSWRYYLQSWIAVGADLFAGGGVETALTRKIERELSADEKAFSLGTTSLRLLMHGTVEVVPIEGKLMTIGDFLMRMDLHIMAGIGMALVAGTGRLDGGVSIMPMFGVGMRFFPTDSIAFGFDVRDMIIDRVLSTRRDGGIPQSQFGHNWTISVFVSFFLPVDPEIKP